MIPGRAGAILLTRHGEPALSRRIKLDSEGYRRWWALYEEGGLLGGQTPPKRLLEAARQAVVICSTRRRSLETAQAVRADGGFTVDESLIEAPLPPPRLPSFLRFSPRTWGVLTRIVWFLGGHQGQESRPAARVRAAQVAERLIAQAEEGRDVVVVAHGYFNAMVGVQLKRRGWRLVDDPGFGYWCSRRFEKS